MPNSEIRAIISYTVHSSILPLRTANAMAKMRKCGVLAMGGQYDFPPWLVHNDTTKARRQPMRKQSSPRLDFSNERTLSIDSGRKGENNMIKFWQPTNWRNPNKEGREFTDGDGPR